MFGPAVGAQARRSVLPNPTPTSRRTRPHTTETVPDSELKTATEDAAAAGLAKAVEAKRKYQASRVRFAATTDSTSLSHQPLLGGVVLYQATSKEGRIKMCRVRNAINALRYASTTPSEICIVCTEGGVKHQHAASLWQLHVSVHLAAVHHGCVRRKHQAQTGTKGVCVCGSLFSSLSYIADLLPPSHRRPC